MKNKKMIIFSIVMFTFIILLSNSKNVFAENSNATTSLLMHMDGTNNSKKFIDESGKTITNYGDAIITTQQSKFGNASAYFDGSGDYLTTPMSSDFSFENEDFTIEAWINPSTTSGCRRICGIGTDTTNMNSNIFFGYGDCWGGGVKINFGYNKGNKQNIDLTSKAINISLNRWHHLAVTRKEGIIYLFFDGTLLNTFENRDVLTPNNSLLYIGSRNIGGSITEFMQGYMEELRIVKGYAKYTSDYKTDDITLITEAKDKAIVGEDITVDVVIHNAKTVCAEDIKVKYDSNLLEYIGAMSIDGIKIYKESDVSTGIKRYITASLGKENAANGDKVFLKLKFKAKKIGQAKVDIINGRVADNATLEMDVAEENCGEKIITIGEIKDVNRTFEFTLLDLAIDAYYYGAQSAETDSSKYDADVVVDGKIDDLDLTQIVNQILNNANYPSNN